MSWMPLVLTRRMVLVGSGAALSGACASGGAGAGSPSNTDVPTVSADVVRDRALAAETDLLTRYDAAIALPDVAADSALKARLTAIRAEHASHAAAIKGDDKAGPTPADSSSSSSSPSPSPSPTDAKTALAGLVKAEQDAASGRTADILAADGGTAMLLASIAASESGHAALLLGGAA
ncbi:MAG: ferritin-like domain-containing protein [Catenulispora sp.]|nr:ferritin-like domain-containing protein [Catenulispora sp.]